MLNVDKLLCILKDIGHPLPPDASVLDFGCGAGNDVQEILRRGFDAFGCDFQFKPGPHVHTLESSNRIRRIDFSPYTLPFPDRTFDFVYSENVLEHVSNYPETMAELARVTKSTGVNLHLFSSRLRPIESHVFVPFASLVRSHKWLMFWAILGIRKPEQRGMSAKEVATQNRIYLLKHTHYHSRRTIEEFVVPHFRLRWVEMQMLKYTRLSKLTGLFFLTFLGRLVGEFQTRALFLQLPTTDISTGEKFPTLSLKDK